MLTCIIVGLGGCIGAILRYVIGLIPVSPASGFPTLSSLALETNQLMEKGACWLAALYVAISVLGSLAAVWAEQTVILRQ